MSKNTVATRKDIDEIIGILKDFMNEVAERFEIVDRRFDSMDARFDRLEAKVDGHDRRITQVETDTTLLKKVTALQ